MTRIAGALYPLLVTFVIVATGSHFPGRRLMPRRGRGRALGVRPPSWPPARARPAAWAFSAAAKA